MKSCVNCRYYDDGECKRYPPIIIDVTEEGRLELALESFWPIVSAGDLCGEYKTKEVEIKGLG